MEENEIGSIVMTAALELRRELGPRLLESGEVQGINFETDLPACSFLFLISAYPRLCESISSSSTYTSSRQARAEEVRDFLQAVRARHGREAV